MTRRVDACMEEGALVTEKSPTLEEIKNWSATCGAVSAGAALGLGRNQVYDLIKANKFPIRILQFGHRYRCVTSELVALLEVSAAVDSG